MHLEYSLVQRSIEREHLPLARAHDIGVTAWSPLAGGILTGKYTRKGADTGSKRMDTMQLQPLDARNREIPGALDGIDEEPRSEERRVGKECVSTCQYRGSRY